MIVPSNNKHAMALFVGYIASYSSVIYLAFTGTATEWIVAFALQQLIIIVGITVTYHRLVTHKAFKAPKWFYYLGSLVGAYGLQGSPIGWASVHIAHHKYSDRVGDPHSPHVLGVLKVIFLPMYSGNQRMVRRLVKDKFQKYLHRYYLHLHAIIILSLLVVNPRWLIVGYLVPAGLVATAGTIFNLLNHSIGYRNFNTPDRSTCNPITAILFGGEGWHNNHHRYPGAASFSQKWWEFDIGYQLVKLIRK
jgi:stearoyl-CoA desaturase (delta-9 desaturase)